MSRDEFATYSEVEFMLSVTNQRGFESNSTETTEELSKLNKVLHTVCIKKNMCRLM